MKSRRTVLAGLAAALTLAGCGRIRESRFNPFNWFGQSEEETGSVRPVREVRDPRPLVDQITALSVEPTPTGGIVRATGLPPMQGWHSAALVAQSEGPVGGEMVFFFRAVPPEGATRVSTVRSRELTAASQLTAQELAATRVVRVVGARNSRVVRR